MDEKQNNSINRINRTLSERIRTVKSSYRQKHRPAKHDTNQRELHFALPNFKFKKMQPKESKELYVAYNKVLPEINKFNRDYASNSKAFNMTKD